jgi:hypothetical protein
MNNAQTGCNISPGVQEGIEGKKDRSTELQHALISPAR